MGLKLLYLLGVRKRVLKAYIRMQGVYEGPLRIWGVRGLGFLKASDPTSTPNPKTTKTPNPKLNHKTLNP